MRASRIAFALIVVALALSGCGDTAGDGDAVTNTTSGDGGGDATVTMVDISFQPDEITVDAGTDVTWVNEDQVGHTTTSDDTNWDSPTLPSGETFSHTFEEPGTYTYFCQIHPTQMRATVIVED